MEPPTAASINAPQMTQPVAAYFDAMQPTVMMEAMAPRGHSYNGGHSSSGQSRDGAVGTGWRRGVGWG